MYYSDLNKIYFIAIGDHENHSVLFEIQVKLLVFKILLKAVFSVMAAANLHIEC